jgi:hypothetical protein
MKQRTRISDDAQRLIDAVTGALRQAGFDDIGELLQAKVFGSGRVLEVREGRFEFKLMPELMMRKILDSCTRTGLTDDQRRSNCLIAIRGAGFAV